MSVTKRSIPYLDFASGETVSMSAVISEGPPSPGATEFMALVVAHLMATRGSGALTSHLFGLPSRR